MSGNLVLYQKKSSNKSVLEFIKGLLKHYTVLKIALDSNKVGSKLYTSLANELLTFA